MLITADNPFANDKLNRQPFVDGLIRLARASTKGATIAIDAEWGAGKSFVAEAFASLVRTGGGQVITYNAFERDFLDDTTVGIMAAMLDALEKPGVVTAPGLVQAGKTVLRHLGSMALNAAVRAATAGAVSASDLTDAHCGDAVSGAISSVSERLIDERLTAARGADAALEAFRKTLAETAQANASTGFPVVVVVDELDRCRPDHAVRTLESIKHLFAVDGVAFFLFYHHEQMAQSIKGVFGAGVDANAYLRKFVDLRLALPRCQGPGSDRLLQQFANSLPARFDAAHLPGGGYLPESIKHLLLQTTVTLRDAERIYGMCVAHLSLSETRTGLRSFPDFLVVCSMLRVSEPRIYDIIRSGTIDSSFGEMVQMRNRIVLGHALGSPNGIVPIIDALVDLSGKNDWDSILKSRPGLNSMTPPQLPRQLPGLLSTLDGVFV